MIHASLHSSTASVLFGLALAFSSACAAPYAVCLSDEVDCSHSSASIEAADSTVSATSACPTATELSLYAPEAFALDGLTFVEEAELAFDVRANAHDGILECIYTEHPRRIAHHERAGRVRVLIDRFAHGPGAFDIVVDPRAE